MTDEQQQGRDGADDLAFVRAWNGEGHDSFGDRWDTARYFFDAGAEFARAAAPPAVGGGDAGERTALERVARKIEESYGFQRHEFAREPKYARVSLTTEEADALLALARRTADAGAGR